MSDCSRRDYTVWTTCPCDDCSHDRARQTKRARCGRYRRVPSDAAWAQLDEWIEAGYSPTWIASSCDVPDRLIEQAVLLRRNTGHAQSFGPTRSAQIVAGDITRATVGRCDARGTRRRLQALAVMGWTVMQLDNECGVKFTTLATIQRGATRSVSARHWRTIAELYERLSDTHGPSREARRRALALGWLPPAAWDNPDDEHEQLERVQIDDVAIERLLSGEWRIKLTRAEKFEAVRRWQSSGRSLNQLERFTGWRVRRYVERENAA